MRPRNPLPLAVISASLLLVAGCSKSEDAATSEPTEATAQNEAARDAAAVPEITSRDGAAGQAATSSAPDKEMVAPPVSSTRYVSPDEAAAPGLTTGAAPGVAFAYRYAFTLPAKAISSVQQQHATACERLGPTKCQITGMSYEQPREGEVAARLDLLLAPDIAQQFGSDSIGLVEQAEGKLENASINGDDAGSVIEQSQRQSAALKAELARIEKRLIAKGISDEERSELTRRAEEMRSQLGNEEKLRQDKEASLATTPMSFAYSSEGLFAAGGDPFGKAADTSLGSIKALGAFVLTFAGLALPWLLLVALIVMLVRFRAMKQRLTALSATSPTADPAASQP